MPRYAYQSHYVDGNGTIIPSGTVTVYLTGTSTLATIYETATGSAASGSQVTSSATDGSFKFFVDTKDYDSDQEFRIVLSKTNFQTTTYDNIAIFPDLVYRYQADPDETDQGATGNGFSIKALVDDIGSNNETIYLRPGSYTLTTNETVPSNITLKFTDGAVIDGAGTLTINGPIEAGIYQIFGSSITLAGSPLIECIYPNWFGAVGDWNGSSGTDNAAAFEAASDWATVIGDIDIVVPSAGSRYWIEDGFEIDGTGVNLISAGGALQYGPSTETYYHCIRVTGTNNRIEIAVYCLDSLVRDDTGFAISLNGSTNSWVTKCYLKDIASAAIWCTDASNFIITGNTIITPDADGIHVSNGCYSFTISDNVVAGADDDSIAVVGDVPAGTQPIEGIIDSNVVRDSTDGNGIVYINCDKIVISNNLIVNIASAGISNYTWVSGTYSTDILIEGNSITGVGTLADSEASSSGMYIQGTKDSIIRNNKIDGITASAYNHALIKLLKYQNLTIQGNSLHNTTGNGIALLDSLSTTSANLKSLRILNNDFYNCAEEPIKLLCTGGTTMDDLYIHGNTFDTCAYTGGITYQVNVDNTGATDLVITSNRGFNGGDSYYFDPSTCTNVTLSGNYPEGIATLADDATPSIANGNKFVTGGTTTITDFDDGVTGKVITVLSEHAITITDGTNIILNGSANFVMAASDSLMLILKADGKWYELSRMVN